MPRPPEDDVSYEFYKSKYTTQYLKNYVDCQKFAGKSLRERIRFSWTAKKIEKRNDRWIVSGTNPRGEGRMLHASKLMVTTGLASTPNMPSLSDIERFQRPVLHQREFGSPTSLLCHHSTLRTIRPLPTASAQSRLISSQLMIKQIRILSGGKYYIAVLLDHAACWRDWKAEEKRGTNSQIAGFDFGNPKVRLCRIACVYNRFVLMDVDGLST